MPRRLQCVLPRDPPRHRDSHPWLLNGEKEAGGPVRHYCKIQVKHKRLSGDGKLFEKELREFD